MNDDDFGDMVIATCVILMIFSLSIMAVTIVYNKLTSPKLISSTSVIVEGDNIFTIENVNAPKHYYLDLKSDKTGVIYRNVYVSKHCNQWQQCPVGTKINARLVKTEYLYDDTTLNSISSTISNDLIKVQCCN